MKKIFITGGHMTPAMAVMEVMKNRNWQIFYIGRMHALEGDPAISQEYIQVKKLGYTFLNISTGRLQRYFTRYTLTSLLKIPYGFFQSFYYILRIKPDVILSFGGYVALPICICGWLLGIPVVTHEQTLTSGLANKIIAKFARKICISWKQTQNNFPAGKVVFTGNPLRKEVFEIRRSINMPADKPVIYITGGNLGAHYINLSVGHVLEKLLNNYTLIHQCGNSKIYNDYEKLKTKRSQLPKALQDRYLLYEYVEPDLIGWVYKQADVLVARPGANTLSEVIALKKPTIYIPLPGSGDSEQEVNAKFLTDQHAAGIIFQKDELIGDELLSEIDKLLANKNRILNNLNHLNKLIVMDSNKRLLQVVESVV